MFYKTKLAIKNGKTQSFRYEEFKKTRDSKDIIYNYSVKDGQLIDGYGIKELTLPQSNSATSETQVSTGATDVLGLWTFQWHINGGSSIEEYVFYLDEDKKMYFMPATNTTILPMFVRRDAFNEVPQCFKAIINDDECFVIMSASDSMVVMSRINTQTYADAPKVMDCCVHYDKIFAILAGDRNALIWSDNTNLLTWTATDTNKIRLDDQRGRLLKIISFNDNLYIFREYGITKVSVYSLSSNFSIDHMYLSSSYIYPKTISICGDKVVFMTRDGLYSFNGYNTTKIDLDLENVEKELFSEPSAICYNGKYFLACKMLFEDNEIGCETSTYVNNVILVVDYDNLSFEIMRGIDVKSFAVLDSAKFSKLMMCFRGSDKAKIGELTSAGSFFTVPSSKGWVSKPNDFGHAGKIKKIEEIYLLSDGDCQIQIETEKDTQIYNILGSNEIQRIKTDTYGKLLKFSLIATTNGQKISSPEVTFTVYQ